jgi:hypothetical protein
MRRACMALWQAHNRTAADTVYIVLNCGSGRCGGLNFPCVCAVPCRTKSGSRVNICIDKKICFIVIGTCAWLSAPLLFSVLLGRFSSPKCWEFSQCTTPCMYVAGIDICGTRVPKDRAATSRNVLLPPFLSNQSGEVHRLNKKIGSTWGPC